MQKKDLIIFNLFFLTSVVFGQGIIINPYLQDAEPTSMSIMWEVDADGKGFCDWGTSPFDLSEIVTSQSQSGSGASVIHTALLPNLIPGSKYYYRVRTFSGDQSYVYHFRTPKVASSESSIHIMAVSDMQRDGSNPNIWKDIIEKGMVPIIQSEIDSDLNALDAILIPGDLVPTGGSYNQWKDFFFLPADSLTPYVPLYPVPGNHEYAGGGLPNFLKYFTLPENGPTGLEEEAWYKDISNVRVIGLNSNSGGVDQDTQLAWLQTTLDATCGLPEIDFVFAQLHHPFKSELWTPGESSFTGEVIEKLENFTTTCSKASVHFFGHTHGYSRGQSRDHNHLWVNVATAGGAIDNWGEFPNADYDEFSVSQDEYGFVLMSVQAGPNPQFTLKRFSRGDEVMQINNALVDSITIRNTTYSVNQPQGIFPNGDTIETNCMTLKGSSFSNVEMTHQATQWQVAKSGDFVDSLVSDIWKQNENWYNEVNTQAEDDLSDQDVNGLENGQLYGWRVRYRNQYLKWSDWSTSVLFYTGNTASDITENLISSGGGEFGLATWLGDIEALMSEECNSAPAYAGSILFAVGGVCANEQDVGIAYQEIDISSYSTQIDNGELAIYYGGFMRDFSGSDVPEIYVQVYDQNDVLMTTSQSVSNANATWTNKFSTINIPIGTRKFRLVLKGTRNSGTDNDCYFDDTYAKLVTASDCGPCFTSNGSTIDVDGDGFCADLDCDDSDPEIYPGAREICDGKDNDCNGNTENELKVSWTGSGDGASWEDGNNWDQGYMPLNCQDVFISGVDTVFLRTYQQIASLELVFNAYLEMISPGQLDVKN